MTASDWAVPGWIAGQTWGSIILYAPKYHTHARLRRHERVHVRQCMIFGPLMLVLGSEREGLGDLGGRLGPSETVTIPQSDGAESLNVAAAGAALFSEMRRQRLSAR